MTESNRKLKVGFVHQPWSVVEPPVRGGDSIARVTDEVARCLIDRAEVICYSRTGPGQPARENIAGVNYHHVSVSIDRWVKKPFDILSARGIGNAKRPFFASRWCYRQFIGQVADDLKREQADVVHLHNFSQFVPLIRKVYPGIKIVLHMHTEWLNQLDHEMIGERLAQVDLVVGVSEYITNQVRKAFPEYAGKCQTVYNGVDIEKFYRPRNGPLPNDHRIVYVGRVSPEKGIHVLVDAFKLVRERFADATLDVLGGEHVQPQSFYMNAAQSNPFVKTLGQYYHGSYMQQMKERSGGEAGGVIFHGDVDHAKIGQFLNNAEVFVHPSVWDDPSPLTLYEALSAGMPVVTTATGGQPEIVQDGITGIVVPNSDIPALAGAMIRLLENDTERQAMGEAARRRAEAFFKWSRVADDLFAAYSRLCGQSTPVNV